MEKYLNNTDSDIDEKVKNNDQSLKSREDSVKSVSLSKRSNRTLSLASREGKLSKQ